MYEDLSLFASDIKVDNFFARCGNVYAKNVTLKTNVKSTPRRVIILRIYFPRSGRLKDAFSCHISTYVYLSERRVQTRLRKKKRWLLHRQL